MFSSYNTQFLWLTAVCGGVWGWGWYRVDVCLGCLWAWYRVSMSVDITL